MSTPVLFELLTSSDNNARIAFLNRLHHLLPKTFTSSLYMPCCFFQMIYWLAISDPLMRLFANVIDLVPLRAQFMLLAVKSYALGTTSMWSKIGCCPGCHISRFPDLMRLCIVVFGTLKSQLVSSNIVIAFLIKRFNTPSPTQISTRLDSLAHFRLLFCIRISCNNPIHCFLLL